MSDIASLFTKVSKVLRDETINEILNDNSKLKNSIEPIFGTNITIKPHISSDYNDLIFLKKTPGIIIKLFEFRAIVIFIYCGKTLIKSILLKNIIINDQKINDMLKIKSNK